MWCCSTLLCTRRLSSCMVRHAQVPKKSPRTVLSTSFSYAICVVIVGWQVYVGDPRLLGRCGKLCGWCTFLVPRPGCWLLLCWLCPCCLVGKMSPHIMPSLQGVLRQHVMGAATKKGLGWPGRIPPGRLYMSIGDTPGVVPA